MANEPIGHRPIAQTVLQLASQMAAGGYKASEIEEVLAFYQAATRLYAGIYRENGTTLIDHVIGTASVLAAYGAPPHVVGAGLLHAAYALGKFPASLANDTIAKRRWIAVNTNAEVEEQVFDYTSLDFQTIQAAFGRGPGQLSQRTAYSILTRIANSIDEYLDGAPLFAADPSARMEAFADQNNRWLTIYRVAEGLTGCDGIVDELLSYHNETAQMALPFAPPAPLIASNFEIAAASRLPIERVPASIDIETARPNRGGQASRENGRPSLRRLLARLALWRGSS